MGFSLYNRFRDHTSELEYHDCFEAPDKVLRHITREQRQVLGAICAGIIQTEYFYGNPFGVPISKPKAEMLSGMRISSDLWRSLRIAAVECEIFELRNQRGVATRWIPGRALRCETGYQNCDPSQHQTEATKHSAKQSTTSAKQSQVLSDSEPTTLFARDTNNLKSSEYLLKTKDETQAAQESETDYSQTAKSVTTQKQNTPEPEIDRVTDDLEAKLTPEWLAVVQEYKVNRPAILGELIWRSERGESPPPPGDPFYRKIAPPSKSKQHNSPRV